MRDLPLFAKTVGRRKTSIANLKLVPGSGRVNVNGYSVESFFSGHLIRLQVVQRPFCMLSYQNFDVSAKVQGGGIQRKAGALQLALTRALVLIRPMTRYFFREQSLLTRNSRKKERRKYGRKKARKEKQFSKRLCKIYL
jgi:small subunit ribosomal protein S9